MSVMSTSTSTEPREQASSELPAATFRTPPTPAAIRRPGVMSIARSEWIKLRSTRSPWWCMGLAVLIPMAFGVLMTSQSDEGNAIFFTLAGMQFASR